MSRTTRTLLFLVLLIGGGAFLMQSPEHDNTQNILPDTTSPPLQEIVEVPLLGVERNKKPSATTLPKASEEEVAIVLNALSYIRNHPTPRIDPSDEEYQYKRAERLQEMINSLKESNPDFESYPFIDPNQALRDYGLFVGGQINAATRNEINSLQKEPEFINPDWLNGNSHQLANEQLSTLFIEGCPPTWIASMALFGQVDQDTIMQQQHAIRDLRLNFLLDLLPLQTRERFFDYRLQGRPFGAPVVEQIALTNSTAFLTKVDFSAAFSTELMQVRSEIEQLRRQYLIGLGNAVYAMQMPTFND